MQFLIFAILFSSLFSVVFKICQQKNIDSAQTIMFNYIVGAAVTWIPILTGTAFGDSTLAAYSLPGKSLVCAAIQGVMFLAGFAVMDASVARSGVALTTVSSRASLILPVILSAIFFGQSAPAWIPVVMVVAAMVMIILPSGNGTSGKSNFNAMLFLVIVFFTYGISDFFMKVSQNSVEEVYGASEDRLNALTGFIFLAASLASLIWCAVTGSLKKGIRWNAVGSGIVLGLINTGCTSSLLRALGFMSTSVFYPLYNIGIVLVASLLGVIFFKERLKWIQVAGMVVAAVAITLFFR